ncbi:MAG: hypothetical protein QOJ49_741 [Actinomycetota bacterium]|jgi:hypothetical protein|nr:hypothetical protein [Actinomycetota bacterium]MDQ1641840.1 hypothetical protein [Actinomycetota bacterium]
MDNSGYRVAVARGLTILERVADDLLGDGTSPDRDRDADADRALIRDAVRRAHQRNARRRPLVSRRS